MKIKEFFKFSGDNSVFKKMAKKLFSYWIKRYHVFFILLFFASLLAGAYFWHKSLYDFSWNDQKKNQYLNSREAEINLQENAFKEILESVKERKIMSGSSLTDIRDFFDQSGW